MSATGPEGGGGDDRTAAGDGAGGEEAPSLEGSPEEAGEGELPASEDHRYFQAIEERFLALRGAPLVLSPAEWGVAQGWRRRGIPLDHVFRVIEEIAAKRKERGARERTNTLRYYARAVESSWEAVEELRAGGERTGAPGIDLRARLAALAAALPEKTPDRAAIAERIAGLQGDTEHVEQALAALDRELLAAAERELSETDRAAVEAQLDETVAGLFGSLFAGDVDRARERLRRQVLRRRLGLPVLSLFSPEAEAGDRPDEDLPAEELPAET